MMFNYREDDELMDQCNTDPSPEELERLTFLKDRARDELTVETTYDLADYYYQNGAIAAARFWARLWVIALGAHDGCHISGDGFNSMVNAMGNSTYDEVGEDELTWMYG